MKDSNISNGSARTTRQTRPWVVSGVTALFLPLLVAAWLTNPHPVQGDGGGAGAAAGGDLPARFERDIWPLLNRRGASCVACHTASNPSQLHLPSDARSGYRLLLSEGRLDPHSPNALLSRVSATDPAQRMPPVGLPAWTEADQTRLREFMGAVAAASAASPHGPQADEQFPPALRLAYTGPHPPAGQDNTLLSYYQLRGKVATLFGDDWRRDDRDQFVENLASLGGADFVTRFDESARATPAYLSTVEALAADVASRAYLDQAGPFAGGPDTIPIPGAGRDGQVRQEIAKLYRRLLFRAPSAAETHEAAEFLRAVGSAPAPPAQDTGPLMFQVTARAADGRQGTAQATISLLPAGAGVRTVFVNEDAGAASEAPLGVWDLKPGGPAPRLVVSNSGTSGQVTFRSVILRGPLPARTETVIGADDPAIAVDGAWTPFGQSGKDGYSDDGNDKGRSRLTVPLRVPRPGRYALALAWRHEDAGVNADAVPVSVYAPGQTHLALPPVPPVPPPGQARFFLDQTVDSTPFWDVRAAFRFGPGPKSGVEIANHNTRKRVVADAVSYLPLDAADGAPALVARADDAVGHERWPIFKPQDFTPYNTIGPDLRSDENGHKGELSLLYPAGPALPPGRDYRVRLTYPGHVDNETRVPVTVYARQSSPIVRLRAPSEAPMGTRLTVDASASYNVQHSPLRFTWSQIGGPRARLSGSDGPTLTVQTVPEGGAQRAWEGLCRALVLHPDFLFTRPRSLTLTRDPAARRRLLLVKLAQDLVGRPPTAGEVAHLDRGASLAAMTDAYLASPDFDRFYFRRVRLYLESHGTPSQDEPARLWRYLLETGRPYTELLTADYTISPAGRREPRPAACGHSGVLTMPGFIEGKPGLPHFNYAAQVCEKFLGYVFEVTPAVVKARGTLTAASTVDPSSICYSCHQVLTPLAYQRTRWTDDGKYREKDEDGRPIDDSDRHAVASYPFQGRGLEAFALAAQRKERFHRAIIQTHFLWFFGRPMRYDAEERGLYRRLWDGVHRTHFALKPLVRAIVTSPEYLGPAAPPPAATRLASRLK